MKMKKFRMISALIAFMMSIALMMPLSAAAEDPSRPVTYAFRSADARLEDAVPPELQEAFADILRIELNVGIQNLDIDNDGADDLEVTVSALSDAPATPQKRIDLQRLPGARRGIYAMGSGGEFCFVFYDVVTELEFTVFDIMPGKTAGEISELVVVTTGTGDYVDFTVPISGQTSGWYIKADNGIADSLEEVAADHRFETEKEYYFDANIWDELEKNQLIPSEDCAYKLLPWTEQALKNRIFGPIWFYSMTPDEAEFDPNDPKDVVFTSSGPLDEFAFVVIDEVKVPEDVIEAEEGSTKITIKADYLQSLAAEWEQELPVVIVSNQSLAYGKLTMNAMIPPEPEMFKVTLDMNGGKIFDFSSETWQDSITEYFPAGYGQDIPTPEWMEEAEGQMVKAPANRRFYGMLITNEDGAYMLYSDEENPAFYEIISDVTLTALWKTPNLNSAIIAYLLEGGTMDGKTGTVTAEAEVGSTITLPAPTREGYSFVSWGVPAWKAGAGYKVVEDMIFRAVWKETGQHTHELTLVEAKEADCTQAGNSAYYSCTECGLWFEDAAGAVEIKDKNSVIIPALGHKWSPWKQTKAPTATQKGEETRVCTRCGEEETRSIPARGSDDDDDDDDDSGSSGGSRSSGSGRLQGYWNQNQDGSWSYFLSGGGLATGWQYLYYGGRSDWYFFDSRGIMQTGWLDWEGSRYYLNPVSNGYMGAMQTGWQLIGGKWYYFETVAGRNLGHMYVNRVTPDGYRTGSDGEWDGAPAAGR